MANTLLISEYPRAKAEPATTDQTLAVGGSSIASAAFQPTTRLVRLLTDTACSIVFGSNPIATVTNKLLPAGVPEYFRVQPGLKLACIAAGGGSAGVLALDGSANASNIVSTLSVTLSTTNGNDLIVVDILTNGGPIVSVTATGLSFTLHATNGGVSGVDLERWVAIASSPLSSASITVTASVSGFMTIAAYGISGANTSSPWDAGGPVTSSASPSDPLSITTHNPNTMVIGTFRATVTDPTAGSGFTEVPPAAGGYQISEYQILSSAQTLSVGLTTGSGGTNGGIVDAVIA